MSRRTRSRISAVALLAGLLVLVVPAVLRPAEAAPVQDGPLIPTDDLIALLEPLKPVLEVVSPIVWPLCANAVLVSVLPGALGVEVPAELANVTGPLLVLCGSVPEPGTNRRVCALDVEAYALLAELTKPVLGSGPPIEVAPVKWLTGLLDSIVDLVDLPGVPLGSTVAATLQCLDPPPDTTTTLPGAPDTVPPAVSIDLPVAPISSQPIKLPTFAELQTLPPLDPAVVAAPAVEVAPVVQIVSQPKFRYPVVMGLPLALVALLVFFGRTLTRPLGSTGKGGTP